MNNVQQLMNEYRKHFYSAYHSKISHLLQRFEINRKKQLFLMLLTECAIIGFAIWMIVCLNLMSAWNDGSELLGIVIGMAICIILI